jgi:hypothetical protein
LSKRWSLVWLTAALVLVTGRWSALAWPPNIGIDLSPITRLELEGNFRCGIPGGGFGTYTMVLCKGGPCQGTITRTRGFRWQGKKTYELPADEFERCRALLHETHFVTMRSSHSSITFETSTSSLTVVWYVAGLPVWRHTVDTNTPAPEPEGYKRIFDFFGEMETRGKLTTSENP